jgi:hypothetical protein
LPSRRHASRQRPGAPGCTARPPRPAATASPPARCPGVPPDPT